MTDVNGQPFTTPDNEAFNPYEYLNNEGWQRVELGLTRTEALMARLGNPERAMKFVHVAGTNGKGSVCAFVESVARKAGIRTGLFTSPAVYVFEERIRVNGAMIGYEDLQSATLAVRDAVDAMMADGWSHPTGFELMFAVAMVYFQRQGCELVVAEVGLGGRLDATNVIAAPEVAVITPIAFDHKDVLGDTLAAIAGEKAAIIKPGSTVVTGYQLPEAFAVIRQAADTAGDELVVVDEADLMSGALDLRQGRRSFTYQGEAFTTHLLGSYQPANASLAIEACRALEQRGWPINEELIESGIAAAAWPGRFEIVHTRPLVIVDGAHNPAGAESLAASLESFHEADASFGSAVFVVGLMADKDYEGIIEALLPWAQAFVCYEPPNDRALPAESLAQTIRALTAAQKESSEAEASELNVCAVRSATEALRQAFALAGEAGVVVCAGSLYGLSAVREGLEALA